MEMKHRIALAMALSILILFGYTYLVPSPEPTDDALAEQEGGSETGGETGDETGGSDDGAGAPEAGEPAQPGQPVEASPAVPDTQIEKSEHRIANELLAVTVDSEPGGLINHIELLDDQFRNRETNEGEDFLLFDEAAGSDKTLEFGFLADETDFGWGRGARAQLVEAGDDRVRYVRRKGDVEVVETLTLLDGYEAKYEVLVRNFGKESVAHRVELTTRMGLGSSSSRYDVHRALCRATDSLEEFTFDDVEDEEDVEKVKGGLHWFGVDSKYFLQAVIPSETFSGCVVDSDGAGSGMVNTAIGRQITLEPGQQKSYEFGLYLGAKIDSMLGAFPESEGLEAAEGIALTDAIDWGWFGALSEYLGGMMLALLRYFYGLTGVWGVAIIMLTVVIKLTLLPLTIKQYRSMRKMKEINPEMQALREKYKDDQVKMNQEMQALFSRHGTSPLSGCTPMLLQFPIWIALYAMLGAVVDLYHESFLWLPDLTQPDPYYILPIGMGALMFLQTSMNPNPGGDEMQAKMMKWMMPGVFVVMMLFLPSGLGVYIFANITLSLIQSFIQLKIPSKDKDGDGESGDKPAGATA
ncbi:60 kDa inner membrane insertion protein [Plesiocystis pacifica SIR-1]|uniref:Membrane protein insertase YidC n=1 Tax=Plesiocystis pacifica SIR-1 TaxID=391625 RepID=A6G3S3_9BACT|nr:membrane protein insertase YidC [Plesiocystis pacifica]EDM79460.1 60 kDa inner membrane insertion protein [Plesiocystis pacifica SIR-1]